MSIDAPAEAVAHPESDIARDLVRRAVWLSPLFLVVSTAIWGLDGLLSSGYGLVLVAVNFLASAALLAWAAPRPPAVTMGVVLGGFLVRMGLIAVAAYAVSDLWWVERVPLGLTIVASHLVLLIWETRKVSISLAFPGLRPTTGGS